MISRSINIPASSSERRFVIFPRRGSQYLWRNAWHKTNLVNVAPGREVPQNTPLSQMSYSAGNDKPIRKKCPGQNPCIRSAFVCCGGHNQMLEMRKDRAILFPTHSLPASNYSALRLPDPCIVYMQLVILPDFVFHELKHVNVSHSQCLLAVRSAGLPPTL